MRRRRNITSVITGVIFLASLTAGVAWATDQTHTINEWYHGLGDGGNDNYYVHPFNESTASHAHPTNYVRLWKECDSGVWCSPGGVAQINSCDCQHSHLSYDTNPYRECKFWSTHSVGSRSSGHSGNAPLNQHYHPHHNECTAVW